jgi:hypothetical protein
VDGEDVGVAELRHRLRLLLEAGGELRIRLVHHGRQDFDGDGAVEAALHAFVNRAHAATADERLHS